LPKVPDLNIEDDGPKPCEKMRALKAMTVPSKYMTSDRGARQMGFPTIKIERRAPIGG